MLSIIIPALNEEKYLPKLLKSIKKQKFRDYEIIVADHNSKDKTRKIAMKSGCIIAKGGNSPGISRNGGFKKSKGSLILFLDADVILPDNFLDDLMKRLEEKNVDCASFNAVPISDKWIDKIAYFLCGLYFVIIQKIKPHSNGPCIFVKRDIHKKINGFDNSLIVGEDLNYVERAAKAGKYRFFMKPFIYASVRRLNKEGRLKNFLRYAYISIYRIFTRKEIKGDSLKYKFGGY